MMKLLAQIVVVAHRERHSVLHQRLEILNQAKVGVNFIDIGAEAHLANEFFAHLADTQFVKALANCLEAYLIFKIRRIYHIKNFKTAKIQKKSVFDHHFSAATFLRKLKAFKIDDQRL